MNTKPGDPPSGPVHHTQEGAVERNEPDRPHQDDILSPSYRRKGVLATDGKAFEAAVIDRHPVGRLGELDEIADVAVLRCGREARFMTGSNITIDGAYSRV